MSVEENSRFWSQNFTTLILGQLMFYSSRQDFTLTSSKLILSNKNSYKNVHNSTLYERWKQPECP